MKTIGLISLAGLVDEKEKNVECAIKNLESLGYRVKLSENILAQNRYLAGSDVDKIEALHKMFLDPEIDIIMSARGGYGSIRLINQIDYSIIRNNPKIFCGYSDITALLLMIYKKTGMITYHGPMGISDFTKINNFTYQNFLNTINKTKLEFIGDKAYKTGVAEGIIWGGNLSTVVSLCGLDFIPNEDFIFFAEDLNEPVYKIDKMFQQLINIEKFRQNCKGIVLGDFLNVDNESWLQEYFQELGNKLKIPMTGGFKITHNKDKITLPIGRNAVLNNLQIKITGI